MLHEIKCPKCQTVFTIDEASYAEIQKQVHNAEFNEEIATRLHELQQSNIKDTELAVIRATSELQREIDGYKKDLENIKSQNDAKEVMLRQSYTDQLRVRDEEIERMKDMKAKLNNKMIGESLEQHCRIEYDKISFAYPYATFEKDTIGESKGDFIFRNYDADGTEIVSIMFEMKNQIDDPIAKQKKNSDHFKKLDGDRAKKNCEYAVLVSMLEPEDEYYNLGMVCASGYDKMYVIRPQFFVQIISLINNLATKSLGYKKELAVIREQNIDIEKFEEKLQAWRESFNLNQKRATDNFNKAITNIDKSINDLLATRKALVNTAKNFGVAERKLENLDIRKLAKGNETMTKMFADLEIAEPDNIIEQLDEIVEE